MWRTRKSLASARPAARSPVRVCLCATTFCFHPHPSVSTVLVFTFFFARLPAPRVSTVVAAAVASTAAVRPADLRGFARKRPKFYTGYGEGRERRSAVVRLGEVRPCSPLLALSLSVPSSCGGPVAVFVCDGTNTSPVDTRQQYITRPTVQTGVPPLVPSCPSRDRHLSLSTTYSHLHVTSVVPKNFASTPRSLSPSHHRPPRFSNYQPDHHHHPQWRPITDDGYAALPDL